MTRESRQSDRNLVPEGSTSIVLTDDLLEGADARDLALGLIDTCLRIHRLRNLRSHVHTGEPDDGAVRRIRELEEMRASCSKELAEEFRGRPTIRFEAVLQVVAETGELSASASRS